MVTRIKSSLSWGPLVGLWGIFFTIIEALVLVILEIAQPLTDIDVARSFDSETYNLDPASYGKHDLMVDFNKVKNNDKLTSDIIDT